jgi:hypothetical protein
MKKNGSLRFGIRVLCDLAVACVTSVGGVAYAQARPHAQATRIKETEHVTGEFRPDGTCQVFVDSMPVFHPADSAGTTYLRSGTINVAPAGFDAHEIWCEPHTGGVPRAGLLPTDRVFVVMLYAPNGELAKPRSYEVHLGLPSMKTAPYRAGAALFGMSVQMLNDTLSTGLGTMYMVGSSGQVIIERIDGDRVVATFSIGTRRALTY